MKALKVLGAIVGTLVLAAAVFWAGWLRAPDGAEVCQNVIAVMSEGAGALPDKAKGQLAKDCVRQTQPPEFGRVPWVKRMKCYRDASTRKELEACDKAG